MRRKVFRIVRIGAGGVMAFDPVTKMVLIAFFIILLGWGASAFMGTRIFHNTTEMMRIVLPVVFVLVGMALGFEMGRRN